MTVALEREVAIGGKLRPGGPEMAQAYARKIAETELKYEKKLQDVEERAMQYPSVRGEKLFKQGRKAFTI